MVWAFAKASESDDKLFALLGCEAEWKVDAFNAQALASTAWAFATANQWDGKLFVALAR